MTETSPEFDWYSEECADCIVVRHRPATAVYVNSHTEVVIRQQADYGDEDHCIYLSKNDAQGVWHAIFKACRAMERRGWGLLTRPAERAVECSRLLLGFIEKKEVPTE